MKNMTEYKPPKYNFEAFFDYRASKLGHYAKHGSGLRYYLDVENAAYPSPYQFVESNVNAIYIVYNIKKPRHQYTQTRGRRLIIF